MAVWTPKESDRSHDRDPKYKPQEPLTMYGTPHSASSHASQGAAASLISLVAGSLKLRSLSRLVLLCAMAYTHHHNQQQTTKTSMTCCARLTRVTV